ncbi:MAG TPA: PIN domain-containing protein [Chromatiales bacterium]|nr:PIN domain-containing protein [Chromatiales bacterium]
MSWVVDASVAVKWFVEEPGSEAARAVLARGEPLLAPDLIVPEVANTAWKKAARGEITRAHGERIVQALPLMLDRIVPAAELVGRAYGLAVRHGHPVYDALYLALAEQADARLVTDDARLVALARRARMARRVRPLVV